MARVKLNVCCGCGYRTSNLEAASRHSDSTGHKIDIFGMITPDDVISRNAPVPRVRVTATAPTRTKSFDELQRKLENAK